MPSRLGFGNTRKKAAPKMKYGSTMHYKNPIMLTKKGKEKIMASDANPGFKKAIADSPIDMYGKKGSMAPMKGKYKKPPNPDFDTKSSMATFKSDAQRKAAYASGYKGKGK